MSGSRSETLTRNVLHWLFTAALALFLAAGTALAGNEKPGDKPGEKQSSMQSEKAKNIEVELSESDIEMPEQIEAGQVEFEIKNGSQQALTFVIERTGGAEGSATARPNQPGVTEPLGRESANKVVEKKVQADGTEKVTANLTAGTYRVFCPDSKQGQGATAMATTFTVVDKGQSEQGGSQTQPEY